MSKGSWWNQIGPKWTWVIPCNIQIWHIMVRIRYLHIAKNGNAPLKVIFTLCVSFSFYRLISSSVCGRFEKYYSCHWPRGHFFLQRSKLGTFQGKFYEKNTFHEGGLWEILKFAPLKLFYLYFNQSLRSAILGTEIEIWVGFGRLTRLKKKWCLRGHFYIT